MEHLHRDGADQDVAERALPVAAHHDQVAAAALGVRRALMQGWFATRPVALADGVLIIACGVALLALFEGEKLLLRRLGVGVS